MALMGTAPRGKLGESSSGVPTLLRKELDGDLPFFLLKTAAISEIRLCNRLPVFDGGRFV